ncbi:hypothetical protein ZIOFF_059726 [Zingiber officinale]|uniref:DUF4378 domain-containing protein n=2 Tax=Zingiber officinale TaxID=94328 RepID=A0A8J5F7R8_ZINOF|nr:hypothetical protein ZIOFF_059726 [Zingiber officinale]
MRLASSIAAEDENEGCVLKTLLIMVGFEAPRNSLDIPISTSYGYHYVTEEVSVKHHSSKVNNCLNGTFIKKLSDGEISRQASDSHAAPSVVARLMGMDSMPEPSPKVLKDEHEIYSSRKSMDTSSLNLINSVKETSRSSTSSRELKRSLVLNGSAPDSKAENIRKPCPRKHPQEELLQKFKKEFESWQASKSWEHSGSQKNQVLRDIKDYQTVAQEILNKEKLTKYLTAKENFAEENPTEFVDVASSDEQTVARREVTNLHTHLDGQSQTFSNTFMHTTLDTKMNYFEHFPGIKTDSKTERPSSPTRIVILKPTFYKMDGTVGELSASSNQLGKECSMKDFLEEVKERLKNDIQGRSRNNVEFRGTVVRSSFGERSVDTKQIARDIAKRIRESVSRDMGATLMRSDSTRSFRGDTQINALDSPEFIRREMRKFLAEKSKNALKNEFFFESPLVKHGRQSGASFTTGKAIRKVISDFSNKGKKSDYWKNKKAAHESVPRNTQQFLAVDSESQRNLSRSFSAPVSGTAFGKLLLEDQHISGARIRRKHESSVNNLSEARRQRNDSFNIKETLSSLKHNLNLRGKENATEVPPSPASVSSVSPDEFCRQDNPSPVSPLEVMEYHMSSCIAGEFSTDAPAREPFVPENIEHGGHDKSTGEKSQEQEIDDMEEKDTSYLRDILITAGFYEDNSTDLSNSRLDELTRPISHQVFEEVEEAYKYGHVDTEFSIADNSDVTIGHKLLFDLVNEALQSILSPKIRCPMLKRWVLGPATPSEGKNLLEDLWNQIKLYLNPFMHESDTLDSIVVQDMKMTTWPTMLYEDMDVVGRQIERAILSNLIDDIVKDLCFWKPYRQN